MKQNNRFPGLAALALLGAVMVGCTGVSVEVLPLPEDTSGVETLTTTISMDVAETRALTSAGVKTFAAGEQLALVYKNTGGATVKVVSEPLPAGDYGKSATFTFELASPDKTKNVTYIYPAAMANADGSVNYGALASQDGTLASLAANLDLCTVSAAWDGEALPTGTLVNQLAICAYTVKNHDGSGDLTSSITGMTVSDGTNSYTVSRAAVAGPIFVAIRPTVSANFNISATGGGHNYVKSLTGKTYAAGNGYSIGLRTQQQIVYTAPTLRGTLTFNNSVQSLVNAGTVDYGTISYSIDEGANWSASASAYAPGTYKVYYKVDPSAGYTGGVGKTLLGNVTMDKAEGWIYVDGDDEDWDQNGSLVLTITGSHGGDITVVPHGGLSAVRVGNTITVTSNGGGGWVDVICAETDYYTQALWDGNLYTGHIPA